MKTKILITKLLLLTSLNFVFAVSAQAQTKTVLSTYLDIKDALVKSNSKTAGIAANGMVSILDGKSDELTYKLRRNAEAISASTDVKTQRKHFNALSQDVYEYVKKTGEKEGTLYKQFCPMAFNNTGAYWLAAEKEINNPYFGSMMLHCGSVKEEL